MSHNAEKFYACVKPLNSQINLSSSFTVAQLITVWAEWNEIAAAAFFCVYDKTVSALVLPENTPLTVNLLLRHIYYHYHAVYYGTFDYFTAAAQSCTQLCSFTAFGILFCVPPRPFSIMLKLFIIATVSSRSAPRLCAQWTTQHTYTDAMSCVIWYGMNINTSLRGGKQAGAFSYTKQDMDVQWLIAEHFFAHVLFMCHVLLNVLCALKSCHAQTIQTGKF